MTSIHHGAIAIVGASESGEIGALPGMSALDLHVDSAIRAVSDAGLTLADVDGIVADHAPPYEISDHLGIRPRWMDGTGVGGASFMFHVRHGAAAIAAGQADVVLITHGESGKSRTGQPPRAHDPASMAGQFEHPYGAMTPYSTFTLPAMAFLQSRGMSNRDLGEVVAAQRTWAVRNSRALRRNPISVDEVLAAPMIAYPFTRDMCCVVTDGGGALVLVSAERAKDLPSADRAVYLLGSGEAAESVIVSQMDDLQSFGAFRRASTEAFRTAGIDRSDVDHLMFYDAFAHLPLYMLEDTGFVGRGESGEFIRAGNTLANGSLPMNTNGGGLSYTHTGRYGMFAIQEAVRQLRGEAAAQVENVEISFVQRVGYYFGSAGSLVLSNRPG